MDATTGFGMDEGVDLVELSKDFVSQLQGKDNVLESDCSPFSCSSLALLSQQHDKTQFPILDLSLYFNRKAVLNLMGGELPSEVLLVASLGRKFVSPFVFSKEETLLVIDNIHISDNSSDKMLLSRIKRLVQSFKPSNLSKEHMIVKDLFESVRNWMKDNPDIIVSGSDKGKGSVICTYDLYNKMLLDHLNNPVVYERVPNRSSIIGIIKRNLVLLKNYLIWVLLRNGVSS